MKKGDIAYLVDCHRWTSFNTELLTLEITNVFSSEGVDGVEALVSRPSTRRRMKRVFRISECHPSKEEACQAYLQTFLRRIESAKTHLRWIEQEKAEAERRLEVITKSRPEEHPHFHGDQWEDLPKAKPKDFSPQSRLDAVAEYLARHPGFGGRSHLLDLVTGRAEYEHREGSAQFIHTTCCAVTQAGCCCGRQDIVVNRWGEVPTVPLCAHHHRLFMEEVKTQSRENKDCAYEEEQARRRTEIADAWREATFLKFEERYGTRLARLAINGVKTDLKSLLEESSDHSSQPESEVVTNAEGNKHDVSGDGSEADGPVR